MTGKRKYLTPEEREARLEANLKNSMAGRRSNYIALRSDAMKWLETGIDKVRKAKSADEHAIRKFVRSTEDLDEFLELAWDEAAKADPPIHPLDIEITRSELNELIDYIVANVTVIDDEQQEE